MGKLQGEKFRSVEEFLEYLPPRERQLVDFLRALVFDCLPGCREKLAFNVPFYYRRSRICFIWPASVPWGNVKKGGVELGFVKGYRLQDELNYLEKGSRKEVYVKTFHQIGELDVPLIKSYLFEAWQIDAGTG